MALFIISFISGGLMCYGFNMITTMILKVIFNIYITRTKAILDGINMIRALLGEEDIELNIEGIQYEINNRFIYYFSIWLGIMIFINKIRYFPEANGANLPSILTLILFSLILNLWFINKIYEDLSEYRINTNEALIELDNIIENKYSYKELKDNQYYSIIVSFNKILNFNAKNRKIVTRLYYFKCIGWIIAGVIVSHIIKAVIGMF